MYSSVYKIQVKVTLSSTKSWPWGVPEKMQPNFSSLLISIYSTDRKVSVTFPLTCVHNIIFSSVWVADWPPFVILVISRIGF